MKQPRRPVPASAGFDVRDLDDFTVGFLAAAVWEGGYDESHGIDRIAAEAVARAEEDCAAFQREHAGGLELFYRLVAQKGDCEDREALGGYCFWMSRVGAGVGFWDRVDDPVGDQLHAATEASGHLDLYEGDDGQLYFS